MLLRLAPSVLAFTAVLLAQGSAPTSRTTDKGLATITPARVREALKFLASDDLLGRDSPSAGLTRAGEYLEERYRKAGLQPGSGDKTFFHAYSLEGYRLDQQGLDVVVELEDGTRKSLVPGEQVRVLRLGSGFKSELGDVEIVTDGKLGLRARKPVLVLCDATNPLWTSSAGARESLRRGGRGEAPVLLVSKEALGDAKVKKAAISLPEPEAAKVALRNVVAMLPGGAKADEIVIVSSHYDHIGIGVPVNGDAINNGADDDASGTVAVLMLAEALAARGEKLPRTIAFVNFSAEEKGLRGSAAFATDPPFPLAKAVCNLNLEMLGRPTPGKELQAWLTGRRFSDLEEIVAPAMAEAGVECVAFGMERQLFGASDNFSLARKGVVAQSISAGSLHADYHKPSDEVSKVDFAHMTVVIRGLYLACIEVASRQQPPQWNDEGKAAIGR